MTWRLTFVAVLVTLSLGCDRPDTTVLVNPSFVSPAGLSILVDSGAAIVTTTVFPTTPLTVVRGSTLTCLDGNHTPQPATIAGTIASPALPSGMRSSVTLPNTGTFTLGCVLQPGIVVTVIVV
jgi:hypothetical protein